MPKSLSIHLKPVIFPSKITVQGWIIQRINGNPPALFGAPAAANGGICPRAEQGTGGWEAFPPAAAASARSVWSHSVSRVPWPRFLSEESPRDGKYTVSRDTGSWPRRGVEILAFCKPSCEFPSCVSQTAWGHRLREPCRSTTDHQGAVEFCCEFSCSSI